MSEEAYRFWDVTLNAIYTLSTILIFFVSLWVGRTASKIHELQLSRELYADYAALDQTRNEFWKSLRLAYSKFIESDPTCPKKLDEFIEQASSPPHIPIKGGQHAREWPFDQPLSSKQSRIWDFVRKVYPETSNREVGADKLDQSMIVRLSDHSTAEKFDDGRREHAKFWDKWEPVTSASKLCSRFPSAYHQILILAWLELALAKYAGDNGKGKEGLFRCAQEMAKVHKEPLNQLKRPLPRVDNID